MVALCAMVVCGVALTQQLAVLGGPVAGLLGLFAVVGGGLGGIVAQLLHQRDVQAQLTAELASRQAEAQREKMEALGRLAGGVAHDINNLLTTILFSAELLSQRTGAQEDLFIREIRAACEQGSRLSGRLYATARGQTAIPEPLDLVDVIQSQADVLARAAGEGVSLRLHLPSHPLPIFMDRSHLEQVLMNLAVNAGHAMSGQGALDIRGSQTPDSVVLVVRDTGGGVPPEVRHRIFEPFFTTKPLDKGTGLGLAVVNGIIQQAGGEISIDDAVTDGAAFRICLPRRSE